MTIHEIKIEGFGKHINFDLSLNEGFNIILGSNESGKSTVAAFVRALLYGMPDIDTCKDRKKYRPWDKNAKFGGNMTFEHNGVVYIVSADFGKTKKEDTISLYNVTADEKTELIYGKTVGETVLGISAEAYDISSYAAQLSSKPDLENANLDYLFDRIMKKSEEDKVSSADILAGKRIRSAAESIMSQKNSSGILENLQQKKASTESSIEKVNSVKAEAEKMRNDYNKMQQALNEEKDRHVSTKTDMAEVARAVETVSLHGDVKKSVKSIKELDTELAEAAQKAKRTRKPMNIIYSILIILCVVCILLLAFAPQIAKVSFLAGFGDFLMPWARKALSYIILGAFAVLLTLWQIIFTFLCNKNVHRTRDELFLCESELAELLEVEYVYGAKKHSYNRSVINEALDKHTSEYKRSRSILENEDNKNKMYSEHLALVEEYTEKIAYTKASADALSKSISEMEDIYVLQEDLSEIDAAIELYKRRHEALVLAGEVMEDAYQRWQSDIGPAFGKNAGEILRNLTEGRYENVKVARNFDMSLKDSDGTLRRAYNYSGATVDQMYLALRLSLVKTLSPADGMLPVILDDPFVQYDSNRKKAAYLTVEKFAKENNVQVIMTTCINEPFYESSNVVNL